MVGSKSGEPFGLLALATLFAISAAPAFAGGVYTAIYTFDCATDGCNPNQPDLLAQGEDGLLYSTLPTGTSEAQDGTIISYAPGGSVETLYRFNGGDGFAPQSGFTLGFDGSLYGTTTEGGSPGKGTAFRMSGGVMTVLYTFTDGSDGAYPWAPPTQTPDGTLYGVTYNGTHPGIAWKITSGGTFSTIATLPSKTQAPLVMATDGNFYGTTQYGGDFNQGTVFRLSTKGKLAIVHSFDASREGATPIGPVMQAADGAFYGTTSAGGTFAQGIVYRVASNGVYKVLHNFKTSEGSASTAGLVQASNNHLYSVVPAGGAKGYGSLFRINTAGTKFQVLHSFTSKTGVYPGSTPTLHTNGTIYGFTLKGGSRENGASGVLYGFTNGLKPFVALQLWAGPPGSQIGILGQGFSGATGVRFGTVPATFSVVNDTYMIATVPQGAKSAKVSVLEPGGNLSTLKKFKVN